MSPLDVTASDPLILLFLQTFHFMKDFHTVKDQYTYSGPAAKAMPTGNSYTVAKTPAVMKLARTNTIQRTAPMILELKSRRKYNLHRHRQMWIRYLSQYCKSMFSSGGHYS